MPPFFNKMADKAELLPFYIYQNNGICQPAQLARRAGRTRIIGTIVSNEQQTGAAERVYSENQGANRRKPVFLRYSTLTFRTRLRFATKPRF